MSGPFTRRQSSSKAPFGSDNPEERREQIVEAELFKLLELLRSQQSGEPSPLTDTTIPPHPQARNVAKDPRFMAIGEAAAGGQEITPDLLRTLGMQTLGPGTPGSEAFLKEVERIRLNDQSDTLRSMVETNLRASGVDVPDLSNLSATEMQQVAAGFEEIRSDLGPDTEIVKVNTTVPFTRSVRQPDGSLKEETIDLPGFMVQAVDKKQGGKVIRTLGEGPAGSAGTAGQGGQGMFFLMGTDAEGNPEVRQAFPARSDMGRFFDAEARQTGTERAKRVSDLRRKRTQVVSMADLTSRVENQLQNALIANTPQGAVLTGLGGLSSALRQTTSLLGIAETGESFAEFVNANEPEFLAKAGVEKGALGSFVLDLAALHAAQQSEDGFTVKQSAYAKSLEAVKENVLSGNPRRGLSFIRELRRTAINNFNRATDGLTEEEVRRINIGDYLSSRGIRTDKMTAEELEQLEQSGTTVIDMNEFFKREQEGGR